MIAESGAEFLNSIRLRAYAKINWSLFVTGKRQDGYHTLDTLLQSVSLYDGIEIIRTPSGLELEQRGGFAGKKESNLCWRAAQAFYEAVGLEAGCIIKLNKYIPVGAGMGGGSVDAAAVLVGLNMLYRTGLSQTHMEQIALKLGADVPFMLRGGLARARGIGEKLEYLPSQAKMYLAAVMPGRGTSTAEIFSRLDSQTLMPPGDNALLAGYIMRGDTAGAAKIIRNDLQPVTAGCNGQVAAALEELRTLGAAASFMTGSGSVCCGLFPSFAQAERACARLKKCGRAFVLSTKSRSLEVISVRI